MAKQVNTGSMGECRDRRGGAGVGHAHPEVFHRPETVMNHKLRERISIDLQGLKAPLIARAQANGMSPSEIVRRALEQALGWGRRSLTPTLAPADGPMPYSRSKRSLTPAECLSLIHI